MKSRFCFSTLVFTLAVFASPPVFAQFDLNKALGELGKQIEKKKGKSEKSAESTGSDSSTQNQNDASQPQGQATSSGEKFCGINRNGRKTECFTGEKISYQGKFDILGIRVGKVSTSDLNRLVAEKRCSVDGSPLNKSEWKALAQYGNFKFDDQLNTHNIQTYVVECHVEAEGATYTFLLFGDINFPEYFAALAPAVYINNEVGTKTGGVKSFTRDTAIVKSLIQKFGEPTTLSASKIIWEGEKGEVASISFVKRNRNEMFIVIKNDDYFSLLARDAYKRVSDAQERSTIKSVPKL